jgi:ABC-type histidine transport system ATPase subunit
MTKLLDEAIAKARALPESEQDLAAEVLLTVIHHDAPSYHLTPEQIEEVKQIRQDLREGKMNLLSEGEMAAFWRKLGV